MRNQQIINNARPMYLARDDLAKRPAKKKKEKPQWDIYLGETLLHRGLVGQGCLCIAPVASSVHLLGRWLCLCCCAIRFVTLSAKLLLRQYFKSRGYESCCQYSQLFLTAVLAHTTSGLSAVDIDRGLLLLLRLLGVDNALLDVAREAEESLFDVDVWFRADFHEGNAELVRKRLTLFSGHCSLLFPITFVANKDLVDAFSRVLLDVREPGANVCRKGENGLASTKDGIALAGI
jgi:hypothetical protein